MSTKIGQIITRNIQKAIRAKNITYREFCEKSGLSIGHAGFLKDPERCNPTAKVLEKIAKYLNIEVKDLVDENLSFSEFPALPPRMRRYNNLVLTNTQRFQVEKWEKINRQAIDRYRHARIRRLDELAR